MQYVKICPDPRCAHQNDEIADSCERCHRLLGQVYTTPIHESELLKDSPKLGDPDPPSESDAALREADRQPVADAGTQQTQVRKTTAVSTDLLTLELIGGGRVFPIRAGQTLGRDDGSTGDPGRVNIPNGAGVDVRYVSRWHCRFDYHNGQWSVTPLNPRDFMSELKAPNPTSLGEQRLTIGQSYAVHDGDRLTLTDVELLIRIN